MSTVEEIKHAIEKLSPNQRAELDAWLEKDWDEWDRQIQQDVASGKLDAWLKQVDADIAAGRVEEGP